MASRKLPAWADYGLLPLLNLALAFAVSGLVVVALALMGCWLTVLAPISAIAAALAVEIGRAHV